MINSRSRRGRRHNTETAELNITAFMNLMVILVPFLLITAVFSRLAVLELNLPGSSTEPADPQELVFQLEVIVREGRIEVGDRKAIQRKLPGCLVRRTSLRGLLGDWRARGTACCEIELSIGKAQQVDGGAADLEVAGRNFALGPAQRAAGQTNARHAQEFAWLPLIVGLPSMK